MKLIIATLPILFIGMFAYTLDTTMNPQDIAIYIDHNKVAAEHVAPHVVKLEAMNQQGQTLGVGTGSHIQYLGKTYILTNKHMCEETVIQSVEVQGIYGVITLNQQFRVKVTDGLEYKILKISSKHDLCLLTSERNNGLELAEVDVEKFEHVTVVGHPRGLPLTIRHGNVISHEVNAFRWISAEPVNFLFINMISYGGNSGSPITNESGKLVGVLFGGFNGTNTEAFCVPLIDIKLFLMEYSLGR